MRAAHRVPSFHDAARTQVIDSHIITISYHACARLHDVRRARVAPEVVGGDGLRRPAEHDADEEDPRSLEHLAEGRHLRLPRLAREHPRNQRVDEAGVLARHDGDREEVQIDARPRSCLLYTSPSPRDS